MKKLLTTILFAGSCLLGGVAAQADKSGNAVFSCSAGPPNSCFVCINIRTNWPGDAKVYEGLFDYDNDGKMVPILAESYDMSADGKTVTFKLRGA